MEKSTPDSEYKKGQKQSESHDILPDDHPLSNIANNLMNFLWQESNKHTPEHLNKLRKERESSECYKQVIAQHPNRHLYSVKEPTKEENIERLMYLFESVVLKIAYLYDMGHISLDAANLALFHVPFSTSYSISFLFWPVLRQQI